MTNSEYNDAYDAAIIDEGEDRSLAFVCDFDSISGVEVWQLTPLLYERLKLSRSPFIVGGSVDSFHVANFVWIVSKEFSACPEARQKWMDAHDRLDIDATRNDIEEYLERAFLDSRGGGKKSRPLLSMSATLAFEMASEPFRWPLELVMQTRLAVIFQMLKAKDIHAGNGATNKRSDKVTSDWLASVNEQNQAKPRKEKHGEE